MEAPSLTLNQNDNNNIINKSEIIKEIEIRKKRLRYAYYISTFASLWQFFNIFGGKLSLVRSVLGFSTRESIDRQFEISFAKTFKRLNANDILFITRGLFSKYVGELFIGLTHILPSPVWSAIVPLQFHPSFRNKYPSLHRLLGTIFCICSALIGTGGLAILFKGLNFQSFNVHYFQYPQKVTGLRSVSQMRFKDRFAYYFQIAAVLWFAYTGTRAYRAALKKRWREHEMWMTRHVGSGQWVSIQRIITLPYFGIIWFRGISVPEKSVKAFQQSAYTGWFFTVFLAEFVLAQQQAIATLEKKKYHTLQ